MMGMIAFDEEVKAVFLLMLLHALRSSSQSGFWEGIYARGGQNHASLTETACLTSPTSLYWILCNNPGLLEWLKILMRTSYQFMYIHKSIHTSKLHKFIFTRYFHPDTAECYVEKV